MIVTIEAWGMILAYILFFLVFLLSHYNRLDLQKDLILATLRMTGQLLLVGWLLTYIFQLHIWYVALLVFLIMVFFGAQTIMARAGIPHRQIFLYLLLSLFLGTGTVLAFYLLLVLQLHSWYDLQYFVPLAGMIIGNSMNGGALAVERYYTDILEGQKELETRAALGANAQEASLHMFRKAFRSSLLPTLTSMTGMGIVFLPGMMTGQILGGAEPMQAILYQITIMLAILAATALSAFLILSMQRTYFFTDLDLPNPHLFHRAQRK